MANGAGLSIPLVQKFYEDDERGIPAKQHLLSLVGSVPKPWETDRKYLARATRAAEASVAGRIIKKDQ